MLLIAVLSALALGAAALYLLNSPKNAKNSPPLHPTVFREFELVKKTKVNHNTFIYRFALPHPEAVLGLPTGQHVSVAATIDGKEVVRSYTPVSNNSHLGVLDLMVKTYPQGNISRYLSERQVGDKVKIRGPKGTFVYTPNTFDHLAMVAGGSGITPMYQIMQEIANNETDRTSVTLVFANVSEEDILLRQELDALAAKRPNQIRVHYVLNTPPNRWEGSTGFVTSEVLAKQLPKPAADRKLLLCGPFPMTTAVKKAAAEIGWEKARAPSKMEHQVFVF